MVIADVGRAAVVTDPTTAVEKMYSSPAYAVIERFVSSMEHAGNWLPGSHSSADPAAKKRDTGFSAARLGPCSWTTSPMYSWAVETARRKS